MEKGFVQNLVKKITKDYGSGIACMLDSSFHANGIKCISTGCVVIDDAIAGKDGGIPIGMITEISGWESSGKTLIAKNVIAQTQKAGGVGVYLDSESAFSVQVAKAVGVDTEEMIYVQPEYMEQVFQITHDIIDSVREGTDEVFTIVWDSLASTPTKNELEGKFVMGDRARILSAELRKIQSKISKLKICFIIINQLREKIGVMYGSPDVTPGGKAVPFHSALRLRTKKGQMIKDSQNRVIGEWFTAKVIKNKVAPPFKVAEFEVFFDVGIPEYSGLYQSMKAQGFIQTKGGWSYFASDESKKFRSSDFDAMVKDDPKILENFYANEGNVKDGKSNEGSGQESIVAAKEDPKDK